MTALTNSFVISKRPSLNFSTGSYVKSTNKCLGSTNLAFSFKSTRKAFSQRRALVVQANLSDDGRSSTGSLFVGGFILGGLIVGTLGCVYAPQQGFNWYRQKDLMEKLPKFIYDEEKALEKQRKKLSEKIQQLNSDIDNVSNQLRTEDELVAEVAGSADDAEAVV